MARRLFLLLFCLFLLLGSREPPWADARVAWATTQALVEHRTLAIQLAAPPYFFTVRNGHQYGYAALGNTLALVPSYLAYLILRAPRLLPDELLSALCSHLSSALLMAGAGVIFFRLCQRRGARPALAALLSVGLCLCTLCFAYARSPYSEALQTFALLWLIERTVSQGDAMTDRGMAGLGAAAGVLLNAKLVYAAVLPACAAYLAFAALGPPAMPLRRFVRGGLVAIAAMLPFIGLILFHNWVKTGSPLRTGYREGDRILDGDLVTGLYGLTLSSGKGALFYSPSLVLGLLGLRTAWARAGRSGRASRIDRAEVLLLLAAVAIPLAISARYLFWHGDFAWGPRYTAPLTPLLLLLCLPWLPDALQRGHRRLRALLVGGLFAAGLFVQLVGASLYWDHYLRVLVAVRDQTCQGWSEDFVPHGYFIPEFSPIRGHLWMLSHMARRDPDLGRDAPWARIVPKKVPLADAWARARLDWWLLSWFAVPVKPRAVGAGIGLLALLGAGTVAAGVGLRRRMIDSARPLG